MTTSVRWLSELGLAHEDQVGASNAALGELVSCFERHREPQGMRTLARRIRCIDGFAVTSEAYERFIAHNRLADAIAAHLEDLESGFRAPDDVGDWMRRLLEAGEFPLDLAEAIGTACAELVRRNRPDRLRVTASGWPRRSARRQAGGDAAPAARSVEIGHEAEILEACRRSYASWFSSEAVADRHPRMSGHDAVSLCVTVRPVVPAEVSGTAVGTPAPGAGLSDMVRVRASTPAGSPADAEVTRRYSVFKPLLFEPGVSPIVDRTSGSEEWPSGPSSLSDAEVLDLARAVTVIESRLDRGVCLEWTKSGGTVYVDRVELETARRRRPAVRTERAGRRSAARESGRIPGLRA